MMGDFLTGLGFDPGVARIVQLILATVIVLVALVATMRLYRYLLGVRRAHQSTHRLELMETLPIDNRRRLVLVRRDGVEHLILVGGVTDVVVEAAIADHRAADHRGADDRVALRPANPRPEAPRPPAARAFPPQPPEPTRTDAPRADMPAERHAEPVPPAVAGEEARPVRPAQPPARLAPQPAPQPAPAPAGPSATAPRAPRPADPPVPAAKRAEPPIRPEPVVEPARGENAPPSGRAEPVRATPIAVRADLTAVRAEPHPDPARHEAPPIVSRTETAHPAAPKPAPRVESPAPAPSVALRTPTAHPARPNAAPAVGPAAPRAPQPVSASAPPASPSSAPASPAASAPTSSAQSWARSLPRVEPRAAIDVDGAGAPKAEKPPTVEPAAPVEPPSREPRIAAAYQEHSDDLDPAERLEQEMSRLLGDFTPPQR
ncbi:flagellar biosynthetic protein FliO [Segnochrobactrum spirostomi]|uniref:Flagellar biosynthesis protein FliO n=1 Tax=Segnochrobactrum spirostomi TaxID=2608987 RepID=A0A6A7Y541_9HYPH|nr:flagellar biosynthetic protein FliO [Segnochrobactrum spirostomi]MQT13876.1 hypothetical protein [Segnochrobactrum spirostomi]